ncbi:MAG: recombinase family protein, partial [Acidobacteriota bacterium]
MTQYYAYTRVSTTRQGETGVSLEQQKAAIAAYGQKHGLTISRWFEEQETAAKRGRKVFSQMLKLLKCAHRLNLDTDSNRIWPAFR